MTVAVKVIVEATENQTAVLYETAGNNRKRNRLHKFSASEPEWTGHIWEGRDLVIEEIPNIKIED